MPPKKAPSMDLELSPRQNLAFNDPAQFLLYGGAKGGGKSWFLCVWIFAQAATQIGNKLFFFRKRGVDFTNTTLETWKKAISPRYYEINPNLKKITVLPSRSVIDYGGLDDELTVEKLNSAEYGGGAIDQAEEIEKDSFAMCRGTLRHKRAVCLIHGTAPEGGRTEGCYLKCPGKNFNYHIRMSANPRQCWLKNDFILGARKSHKFIPALPTDNPYLPDCYVDNLREAFEHRPDLLRAYLDGSWDEIAGSNVCIKHGDIQKNKGKQLYGPVTKRIIVNDTARFGDDENVIYVMEERNGVAYVAKSSIMTHRSTMDTAGRLAVMRLKENASDIFVEAINVGAGVVDALNDLGEPVHEINVSNKPTIETMHRKYAQLRSQLWVEAGEVFAKGGAKTDDEILDGQLSSATFDYKASGIIQVEGKKEIKKRLGRSPDRADAFIIGLYGLSIAKELTEIEYENAATDRAGRGTPIQNSSNEFTPFPDSYPQHQEVLA